MYPAFQVWKKRILKVVVCEDDFLPKGDVFSGKARREEDPPPPRCPVRGCATANGGAVPRRTYARRRPTLGQRSRRRRRSPVRLLPAGVVVQGGRPTGLVLGGGQGVEATRQR